LGSENELLGAKNNRLAKGKIQDASNLSKSKPIKDCFYLKITSLYLVKRIIIGSFAVRKKSD
jgi:hypothetical protein